MSSNRRQRHDLEANQPIVLTFTLIIVGAYFFLIHTTTVLFILFLIKRKFLNVNKKSIAFMHPNCSAQGGGEKVLWTMIKAIINDKKIKKDKSIEKIVIYVRSDDEKSKQQIIESTKKCFGLSIDQNSHIQLELIKINLCKYADPHKWRFLTIIMEAICSNLATIEAIFRFSPEIYVDSTGYGYALCIPKILSLGQTKTFAYVHYPIMQRDMIKAIKNESYNNKSFISNNEVLRTLKMIYYKILFYVYHRILEYCDVVCANSTWTFNHLTKHYNLQPKRPKIIKSFKILYPPCDVSLSKPSTNCLSFDDRANDFLSIGQFRPEKNHKLLIQAFAKAIEEDPLGNDPATKDKTVSKYKLIMIGGCRNQEDQKRLEELKTLAKKLEISDNVQFYPNLPFDEKNNFLKLAKFGVHGMIDEHFGIVLVEFQAAGVICSAHNSAGPKYDIIQENNEFGFLWKDEEELTNFFIRAAGMSKKDYNNKQAKSRKACQRFSDENFAEQFIETLHKIL